jgi:hypothetical protein
MQTLSGLLLLLAAVPASACSCIDFPTPSEELVRSDAAFAGKVVNVSYVQANSPFGEEQVRFRVRRDWKESCGDVAIVYTGDGCGQSFELGKYYLVYANQNGQHLYTGMCHRTQLLSEAAEDLASLGEPDLLASILLEEQVELFARVGVIGAAGLALLALFLLRNKRSTLLDRAQTPVQPA